MVHVQVLSAGKHSRGSQSAAQQTRQQVFLHMHQNPETAAILMKRLLHIVQGAHTEPGGRQVRVQTMALLFGLLRNLRPVFALSPSPEQVPLHALRDCIGSDSGTASEAHALSKCHVEPPAVPRFPRHVV